MPTQPDPSVGKTLASLIQTHGRGLASEPSRVGALLRDLAGAKRLEISLLVGVAETGVASEIAGHASMGDRDAAAFAQRVADDLGVTLENATWAVGAWADALGAITVPVPPIPPPPSQPTQPITPTPSRSRRSILIAALAVVLVLALVGTGMALRRGDTGTAAPTDGPGTGQVDDGGTTPSDVPSPADACDNLPDIQDSLPKGYERDAAGVCVRIPINRPASVTATSTASWDDASVTLRWDPPADGAKPTRYFVYRDDAQQLYRRVEDGRSFTDTRVVWGSSHRYWVRAVDGKRVSPPAYQPVSVGFPPVSEAHLAGSMSGSANATYKSPSISGTGAWDHSVAFTFSCSGTGPCQSVAWRSSDTGIPGCTTCSFTTQGTLRRSGSSYTGTYSGFAGLYCGDTHKDTATVTLTLVVSDATPIGGVWTATRVTGTMRVYDPPQASCTQPASINYAISAAR